MLSRRRLVPEAWLADIVRGVGASCPTERMSSIIARLREEQDELKRYQTMSPDDDSLDGEDMVRQVSLGMARYRRGDLGLRARILWALQGP